MVFALCIYHLPGLSIANSTSFHFHQFQRHLQKVLLEKGSTYELNETFNIKKLVLKRNIDFYMLASAVARKDL